MIRRFSKIVLLAALTAWPAFAQINVRGQILLPNGETPTQNIRFYLMRDDGSLNDYRFTDSNGRFILERLTPTLGYTIIIESDGSTYDTTRFAFMPAYEPTPRITLRPLERTVVRGSATVSVGSAYRPTARATELHREAMREVQRENFALAEKLLREAIAEDALFMKPLNDLGVLLMRQKKYAEAEPILRRAYGLDPKSVHALLNLGATLNYLKRFEEAIPLLREALRVEPGTVAGHLHLGIALVETDRFAEAEAHLTRATKSPGAEEVPGLMYLGKLYGHTGRYERGIAALETYLRLAPNAPNTKEVQELIERMKRELAALN